MIERTLGAVCGFATAVVRVGEELEDDAVSWLGSMERKADATSISLVEETCRELDISLSSAGRAVPREACSGGRQRSRPTAPV
jgi:hypothetical protein